jgi:hypothetical protein
VIKNTGLEIHFTNRRLLVDEYSYKGVSIVTAQENARRLPNGLE